MPAASASGATFEAGQTWRGGYQCRERQVSFTLEFRSAVRSDFDQRGEISHDLEAVFSFDDSNEKGSFVVAGNYEEGQPLVRLEGDSWIDRPNRLYKMVGLWGTPLEDGTQVKGRVLGGFRCSRFTMNLTSTDAVVSEPRSSVAESAHIVSAESKGGINQPMGIWLGLARCKGRAATMQLDVKTARDGGRYAARLIAPKRYDFYLVPQGNGRYEIQDKSGPLNRKTQILSTDLFGETLSINSLAGCTSFQATRFTAIDGLGGKYAEATEQTTFCSSVVSDWLSEGRRSLKQAKKLMADKLPLGSGFNPERSATQELLGAPMLERYFGSGEALTNAAKQALKRQVGSCALIDPKELPDTWALLFDRNDLLRARAGVGVMKPLPEKLKLTPAFEAFIDNGKANKAREAQLDGWQRMEAEGASVGALEAYLKREAENLSYYPPGQIETAIAPLVAAIDRRRGLDNALASEAQRKKFKQLLGRLDLPLASLNPRLGALLAAMSKGEQIAMTSDDLLYLGGLTGYMLDACPAGQPPEDRIFLANFVGQAAQRAGMGSNYSDSDVGRNVGSIVDGQAKFASGHAGAKNIGCESATPILSVMTDLVDSMKTDTSGRESVFVRTCSVEFSVSACRCLADVGVSVYPDIYQRRYSGGIINGIVRRNPIAGAQIFARCSINNY